jgi:predicted transcriptional regulator
VRTGAIPKFLRQVSEKLDKTTEEYKQVSEAAEKLAQAVA